MRYRSGLVGLVMAAVFLAPVAASASSLDDVQAQIASLLAQITDFQAQLLALRASQTASTTPSQSSFASTTSAATTTQLHATVTPVSSGPGTTPAPNATVTPVSSALSCPTLGRALTLGVRGDDVMSLQQFLVGAGLLAPDSASGYFGVLTQAAVQKWQTQNNIVMSGTAATTGFGAVGAKTRAAILAACGGSPLPMNDTLSVGTSALSATVHLNVNVKGSCGAITYKLNWGDGVVQSFSVPAGSCTPMQQVFTHAYSSAGTRTIVLTSGAYAISAPIQLAEQRTCNAPVFATDTIPGGIVGKPWSLPLFVSAQPDDLQVNVSGAPANLSLQRTIIVNASSSVTSYMWSLAGEPALSGTYFVNFSASNQCGTTTRTISLPVSSSTSAVF